MKYVYAVEWVLHATGYRHISHATSVREAVTLARSVYAALYCAAGGAGGGDDPACFPTIRHKDCQRVTAEPRNRAFTVSITKRPPVGGERHEKPGEAAFQEAKANAKRPALSAPEGRA